MEVGKTIVYNGNIYNVIEISTKGLRPIIIERCGKYRLVRIIDGEVVAA